MSQIAPSVTDAFRPADESDREWLWAMVDHDVAGTPYAEVPRYFLRLALDRRSRESRAIVAQRGDEVVGFALYGEVAGSVGTGRMHFVSVADSERGHGIGGGLCKAAIDDLAAHGARVVVAEIPGDPSLARGLALLMRSGFTETARVRDYYRDDVDLVVVQRVIG